VFTCFYLPLFQSGAKGAPDKGNGHQPNNPDRIDKLIAYRTTLGAVSVRKAASAAECNISTAGVSLACIDAFVGTVGVVAGSAVDSPGSTALPRAVYGSYRASGSFFRAFVSSQERKPVKRLARPRVIPATSYLIPVLDMSLPLPVEDDNDLIIRRQLSHWPDRAADSSTD